MSSQARILIVDDTPDNVLMMRTILQTAGYQHIESVDNGRDILERIKSYCPDLLILDLMMGPVDGYEVLIQIRQAVPADDFLPVLVITADGTLEARKKALCLGATAFLMRPHENFDLVLWVRNLLQSRFLHLELLTRNERLETQVHERTLNLTESQIDLKLSQLDVIERLALVGEHHDDDTGQHTYRVAHTSRMLAEALGLTAYEMEILYRAAPLHDVGKIGVSDTILLKPAKLTTEEFEVMKGHCKIGAQLLCHGRSELMQVACLIAMSHHERWDGRGYPCGLQGENIPLVGRIIAVADVFDALTHERPYKQAWSVEAAVEEIRSQSGRQFDPKVVEAFLTLDHESLL